MLHLPDRINNLGNKNIYKKIKHISQFDFNEVHFELNLTSAILIKTILEKLQLHFEIHQKIKHKQ